MSHASEALLFGFEVHSTEKIREALAAGVAVNGLIGGRTPLSWLIEMYLRSERFPACVRTLLEAGAECPDAGLLAVLLDDPERLRLEIQRDPTLVTRRVDLRCAFTPLLGATLLHVAAEFGLLRAARVLLECGAEVEARAALDGHGFNGHTPIFHTVCQHRNHGLPVLRLLLEHGARPDVRLAGITWGKGFEWETTIFDATPMSYAQAGLLRQFQREEQDVYGNIRLLARAAGRLIPDDLNVPNRYLAG